MEIDPDFQIHLDSGFGVGLSGLGVALLMGKRPVDHRGAI